MGYVNPAATIFSLSTHNLKQISFDNERVVSCWIYNINNSNNNSREIMNRISNIVIFGKKSNFSQGRLKFCVHVLF